MTLTEFLQETCKLGADDAVTVNAWFRKNGCNTPAEFAEFVEQADLESAGLLMFPAMDVLELAKAWWETHNNPRIEQDNGKSRLMKRKKRLMKRYPVTLTEFLQETCKLGPDAAVTVNAWFQKNGCNTPAEFADYAKEGDLETLGVKTKSRRQAIFLAKEWRREQKESSESVQAENRRGGSGQSKSPKSTGKLRFQDLILCRALRSIPDSSGLSMEENNKKMFVGSEVRVNGHHFPGTIQKINHDGTFDINFTMGHDSGVKRKNVPANEVRFSHTPTIVYKRELMLWINDAVKRLHEICEEVADDLTGTQLHGRDFEYLRQKNNNIVFGGWGSNGALIAWIDYGEWGMHHVLSVNADNFLWASHIKRVHVLVHEFVHGKEGSPGNADHGLSFQRPAVFPFGILPDDFAHEHDPCGPMRLADIEAYYAPPHFPRRAKLKLIREEIDRVSVDATHESDKSAMFRESSL